MIPPSFVGFTTPTTSAATTAFLASAAALLLSLGPAAQQNSHMDNETITATTKQMMVTQKCSSPPADLDANQTPFGAILRGETPFFRYAESPTLLAFSDRTPRAPLHALIIPKRRVPSVYDLHGDGDDDNSSNEENAELLVTSMRNMAMDVLEKEQPTAFHRGDYVLSFHVPPFYSVDHLHLHVLAPASEMGFVMRHIKYRTGTRWCVDLDYVVERVSQGKPSLPPGYPWVK